LVVEGFHVYADEGSYNVTISISDDGTGTASGSVSGTITIPEADSLNASGATITPVEGTSFSGTVASFTDTNTGNLASDFSATIDWGDGHPSAGTVTGSAGSFTVTGTHTYAEEGFAVPVTVTINDDGAGSASATANSLANISDAALHASGTNLTEGTGVPFSAVVASFSDDDPAGTATDYTATIDWGDGHSSAGTISGGFDVNGSHTYTAGGSYAATVTIQDVGGSSDVAHTTIAVASADVALSLGAAPNPVKTGNNLVYTVTTKNAGPDTAANITISDPLPATSQFVSVTAPGWSCLTPAVGSSGLLTCSRATLANGASASIKITVQVVGSGKTTISDSATVTSATSDPNPANNTASVTTSIFGRH
jgi:uncharacterized repeat protein (TIGR01451 family)